MTVLGICQIIQINNLETKFHNVLMSRAVKSWNIYKKIPFLTSL